MKKIVINLFAIGLIGASVAACSSGSSSSGPAPAPATIAVDVPVPAGFTPFGVSPSASDSTTPVAYDGRGSIAIPNATTGQYQEFVLPKNINDVLFAANEANKMNTIQVGVSGPNVTFTIPSADGGEPEIFVLTPLNQTPPTQIAVGAVNSDQAPVVLVANSGTTQSDGIQATNYPLPANANITTNIIVNPKINNVQSAQLQAEAAASFPLTGSTGCTGWTGQPSTIQIAVYSGITYVGAGSSTGQVCVLTVANPVNTSSWTSLTSGAGTAEITSRYVPGNVNQFQFYAGNPSALYGYWNVNSAGANQVYRVTSSTSSINVPQSFWNTTISTTQTSSTLGGSVTFSGVPTGVNTIYTDNNNNVYVGTLTGSVYKLTSGFTQWTSTTLTNGITGPVTVTATSTGTGATATGISGSTGKVQTYTVN